MKIRFVHADPNLGNVSINIDGIHIMDLGFGDVTPYESVVTGKLKVTKGKVVILKRDLSHHEGMYTAVIASGADFVLYKDKSVKNLEGTASLHFYHLGSTLPSVDIMMDGKLQVQDLAYLQVKKATVDLGSYFHTLRVVNAGKDVLPPVMISPSNKSRYYIFIMEKNGAPVPIVVNQLSRDMLVEDFSAPDYMGEWNLISEFPQPYEQNYPCDNQKAVYTLLHNGVKVHNSCIDSTGKAVHEVYGFATVPDKTQPAALRVDFPNPVGAKSTGPNYLVHKVNYDQYAVVGSPNRSSFYILSRSPTMSKKRHESLVQLGKDLGYDMSKLKVMNGTVV